MALTPADRVLLQRCLNHEKGAWNDFVDRFLGLIFHIVHHTAHQRSVVLQPADVEDVAAEILLQIVAKDYQVLRNFQGRSSLSTYLTVVARRTCVQELAKMAAAAKTRAAGDGRMIPEPAANSSLEPAIDSFEEVQNLLSKLPTKAREIVRLHYLEGRSYEEISRKLNVPVNSIGPVLSRAKQALRKQLKTPTLPRRKKKKKPATLTRSSGNGEA